MSFDYGTTKAVADDMIAEFGQAGAILRRTNSGPKNDPEVSESALPVTLVVTRYSNREVDGVRVLSTDKKLLMAANGVDPVLSDRVTIGGEPHAIVHIEPVAPAGVVVVWKVQCRR